LAASNPGVAALIKQNVGGIGYIELPLPPWSKSPFFYAALNAKGNFRALSAF